METFYHISDIKKFMKCERLYYLGKNEKAEFKPYLRSDDNINDLLAQYFHFTEYYVGQRNDATERFLNEFDHYEYFVHTRIQDGNLRLNIPYIHKVEGGVDLCFIQYGTQIKELDLITYRSCVKALSKYNISVKQIYIIYLNGDYVCDGTIDVDKLFICTNKYKDEEIIQITNKGTFDYETYIEQMNQTQLKPAVKTKNCKLFGICDYYNTCFPNEETLESDSILTLVSSRNKNKMFNSGIRLLKDADISLIEGTHIQYAQIMASKNNGLFIDKLALKNWLDKISVRPISFIDFEWDRYLIPKYEKMKPLDVLCFEYALYYIDENGKMEHRTFVQTGDCRKEFVESMIRDLPSTGPILAYNAQGAECLRLLELGEMYPEYKQQLDDIVSRFVDLATPFLEGLIYDVRMEGNYTLKKLVDICSDYSYKNLNIYDGMEAVYNWRDVDKGTSDDKEKVISDLKEYCSLDAYGLFLVYRWLIKLLLDY